MAQGKSIRIYLPTGSVNGIRHAEISNWTGQAISCPRSDIKALNEWLGEVSRPGVYFLFGVDTDTSQELAYIGEAENVFLRLKDHIGNKDFWTEVIFFTSKDETITKSHVKYLESTLIEQAKEVNRYQLHNAVSSNKPTLPRADRDAMNEFASNVVTLLGALGHKLLEHYSTPVNSSSNNQSKILRLLNKNAFGELVSDGFLVHKGSEMALTQSDAQRNTLVQFFELLVEDGHVSEQSGMYVFNDPQLFSSPSYAASILNGYPTNGLDAWRNESGQSLNEIEKAGS